MMNKINSILLKENKLYIPLTRRYYEIDCITSSDFMNPKYKYIYNHDDAVKQMMLYAQDYNFSTYVAGISINNVIYEYLIIAEMFAILKRTINNVRDDNIVENDITLDKQLIDRIYITNINKIIEILNNDNHINFYIYQSNPAIKIKF